MAVGPAVVVDKSLAKVITVVERRARDTRVTVVNTVHPDLGSPGPPEAFEFGRELRCQRRVEPVRLRWRFAVSALVVDAQLLASGRDDPGTLHACPGAQIGEGTGRISQCGQTVKYRINQGVQGNVGRREPGRRTRALRFFLSYIFVREIFLCEIFPKFTCAHPRQLRVVMRPVYIPSDQIAESAAHHHIGGKVFPGRNPRQTDSRGRAVSQQFGQRSGILVSDHAGHRPGGHGML